VSSKIEVGIRLALPRTRKQEKFVERDLLKGLKTVVGTFPQNIVERGINRNWKQYTFLLKSLRPFLQSLPQGARVCDIGAGAAVLPLVLAQLGLNVSLIDRWSEYASEFDNQMGMTDDFIWRFRHFGVSYYNCDFLTKQIPLPDNSQDFVSAFSVLEHLPRPRILLDEIRRLLRPGGLVVILLPNAANLQNRIRLLLGKSPHPHHWKEFYSHTFFGHYREVTRQELREIFEVEGYEILHLEASNASQTNTKKSGGKWEKGWKPTSLNQLIRGVYLMTVALHPSLRYDLLLVARKPGERMNSNGAPS
jgi:ubiquinone/menaquinone biosynthesis C-methylase UbiE